MAQAAFLAAAGGPVMLLSAFGLAGGPDDVAAGWLLLAAPITAAAAVILAWIAGGRGRRTGNVRALRLSRIAFRIGLCGLGLAVLLVPVALAAGPLTA